MRIVLVSHLSRKSICLVYIAIPSCDSFKEDSMEPGNQVTLSPVEFYTLPASSIIIVVKQSFIGTSLFSPAGDLVLATGLSNYDPNAFLMTISKSSDMGKTWVDLIKNMDGYPLQTSVPSAKWHISFVLRK